jgi:hypothetical protein
VQALFGGQKSPKRGFSFSRHYSTFCEISWETPADSSKLGSTARPSRYVFELCKTYIYLEKYEGNVRFQILFAFSKGNEK